MKIYVGCALLKTTDGYLELIQKLKEELRQNHEVLDFLDDHGSPDLEVYLHDSTCVKNCDLMLAECSLPSTGLGFEIALALSLGKKIIGIAHKDALVTKLILGINDPNFKFVRYENITEVVPAIAEAWV